MRSRCSTPSATTTPRANIYLTDIVEIAARPGPATWSPPRRAFESVLGINNRAELAEAEAIWQRRRRRAAMLAGVTLIAPETVYFSHDTEIGADTVVEPNVWFGPGVKIAAGAKIHAFSHIEGAHRRDRARGRALRAAAARRRPGREGQGRQFRRGQEGDDRRGRQGQPPDLYRRCPRRRRAPISAPAPSPATMTAINKFLTDIGERRLRRLQLLAGRAGDDRRRRLRRVRQRHHRKTCPTTRWPSAARGRRPCPARARKLRERFAAAQRRPQAGQRNVTTRQASRDAVASGTFNGVDAIDPAETERNAN